jgi:hypothetical protein
MSSDANAISIQDQLLRECRAMAKHAFASGLKLPGSLVQTLENIVAANVAKPDSQNKEDHSADEIDTDKGQSAGRLTLTQSGQTIQQLVQIHGKLADLVAPATPRTILLLSEEAARGGFWQFLGPVPLIRRMMFMAMASLVTLIAISLTESVNGDPRNFSLFSNSGLPLLLNEMFLLSAAGIGASFAALFQASRYVQEGTFDPMCESTYWIRFVLGLLAGTTLAGLVPIETFATTSAPAGFPTMGKPLLALLGGFSAVLVYRILNRLIDTVDSLVRGSTKDLVVAQQQTAKARAAEYTAERRMQMLAKLATLRKQLNSGANPQELELELDRIQQDLVSPEGAGYMATMLIAETPAIESVPSPPPRGKAARVPVSLVEADTAFDHPSEQKALARAD